MQTKQPVEPRILHGLFLPSHAGFDRFRFESETNPNRRCSFQAGLGRFGFGRLAGAYAGVAP